jgi:preprotein translocase subunit SecY
MFRGFSQLFSKENKDLRKRLYLTLFCLGIFCLGTSVTVPWATEMLEKLGNFDLGALAIFDIMSGGGLKNFSIFGLGVSPYITASIITQLLQMDIIPYFKDLKDQGYVGRQKINKINRYLGIIAFFQAYVLCLFYMGDLSIADKLQTALIMTAGTAFCLWMGDQITNKGLGNGQSMLIMAGIVLSMPSIFKNAFAGFITSGTYATGLGILFFSLFILVYLLIIVGIIWVQLAERRIPIQYANRSTSAYGAQQSFLPIKLNSAGVIPVIFASIVTTIPVTIAQLFGNTTVVDFINKYIVYTSPTGFVLYIILILFFGYFYTFLVMNPEEMSKNLNERGGYIPGVRPGTDTSNYISNSMSKLTLVGDIFLAILAAIPIIFTLVFTSDSLSSVTIGGTGILIVVGVAIETYKQLESSLISRSYSAKRKRLR